MRRAGYLVAYGLVWFFRRHLSLTELFIVLAIVTAGVVAVHLRLKKGDAEILKKVQASQDRYEYEQEKKALAAKRAPKPEGTYRE